MFNASVLIIIVLTFSTRSGGKDTLTISLFSSPALP
jgi:hypothetical protein